MMNQKEEVKIKSGTNICVPCDFCKKSFYIPPWRIKKHKLHFCSTGCKNKFQRERNKEYQPTQHRGREKEVIKR